MKFQSDLRIQNRNDNYSEDGKRLQVPLWKTLSWNKLWVYVAELPIESAVTNHILAAAGTCIALTNETSSYLALCYSTSQALIQLAGLWRKFL